MPLTSQDEYTYNVVKCFMQKKDFNKPRSPAFSYANWHWPTKSKHRPTFFPLTAMIQWFSGTVAKIEVKHVLFGPLELPSKTDLNTPFFSGFLRVFYGFPASLKTWGVFLETRCFTDQDSISTLYNGFSTGSKFHHQKNIISHHGKQIWHWDHEILKTMWISFVSSRSVLKSVEGWIIWNMPP